MNLFSLLHQLAETHTLSLSQWETLISGQTPELAEEEMRQAPAGYRRGRRQISGGI